MNTCLLFFVSDAIRLSNSRIDACSKWLEATVVPEFAHFLDASKNRSLTSSSSGVDRIQSEVRSVHDRVMVSTLVNTFTFSTFSLSLSLPLPSLSYLSFPRHVQVDQLDEGAALVSLMHTHGINVRYLLLLLSHVEHHDNRRSVLTEAAARVLKHAICGAWRQLRSTDARAYHAVAAEWLRLAFGTGPDCTHYWSVTAIAAMRSYFVLPLEGNALGWLLDGAQDMRVLLGTERMRVLLHRTLDKCGIELVPGSAAAFAADDVARIVPRVKHLSRIAFEEGLCFSRMAESAPRTDDALRLYTKVSSADIEEHTHTHTHKRFYSAQLLAVGRLPNGTVSACRPRPTTIALPSTCRLCCQSWPSWTATIPVHDSMPRLSNAAVRCVSAKRIGVVRIFTARR